MSEDNVYIGRYQVDSVKDLDDGMVEVIFIGKENEDGSISYEHEPVQMKKELFVLVKSENLLPDAQVTDAIRHVLATKIISDFADLGLSFDMLFAICDGAGTLAHNLRDKKIGELFACGGSRDIPLDKII